MARDSPKAADQRSGRRKPNPLHGVDVADIDYKDAVMLRRFISDRGKIRSRRTTGLTPRQQKAVAQAIKNAREMALLPYPTKRAG